MWWTVLAASIPWVCVFVWQNRCYRDDLLALADEVDRLLAILERLREEK